MKSFRKVALVASAALIASVLSGCAAFSPYNGAALQSSIEMRAGVASGVGEQKFALTNFGDSFQEWLAKQWWGVRADAVGSIQWVPSNPATPHSSSATFAPCTPWVKDEPGTRASSLTETRVFRLINTESEPASDDDVKRLIEKAASDLKREGWFDYTKEHKDANIAAGQIALISPADPKKDYPYKEGGEALASSDYYATSTDYISFRVTIAPRGDGYFALYTTAPCGSIPDAEYNVLASDASSAEYELIKNDKNPPAPEDDKGETNTPEEEAR